jgi:hypothetical protein
VNWLHVDWRGLLARLPLPTLALAASWGVYQFNLLFLPPFFAIVSAASFELVYIALSAISLTPAQQQRATWIARAAVGVSVLYNSLAGLLHLRPALLEVRPLWIDIALAILHGAPLAMVAYAVSALLLHQEQPAAGATQFLSRDPALLDLPRTIPEQALCPPSVLAQTEAIQPLSTSSSRMYACPSCSAQLSFGQYGAACRRGYCNHCKPQH